MSALQNEIDRLNTLKESFSELSKKVLDTQAVLTELNNGKQEMVDALAMKNVQSSTDKTLSAIASDIRSIAQSPITIEGGEMYEKQLFGAPTDKTNTYEQPDSPMWNLYQVMTNLLSDGRFVEYGGILLAEYYKDYDTIELSGAGAGGAYVTSDGAYYTNDITHTWNHTNDDKSNRWVSYLFANAEHDFYISNTNTCPHSIHIGRSIGTITALVDTKISEIVVTDGNTLKGYDPSGHTNYWNKKTILRNIENITSQQFYKSDVSANSSYYIELLNEYSASSCVIKSPSNNIVSLILKAPSIRGTIIDHSISNLTTSTVTIDCEDIDTHNRGTYQCLLLQGRFPQVALINLEEYTGNLFGLLISCKRIYIGYKTNDKERTVLIGGGLKNDFTSLVDIEIKEGWCKTLSIAFATSLTEANMYSHILQRLKQDEEMCGSGVTITLGATNLAKLTSEEAVALLDSLTNIYGYTFA